MEINKPITTAIIVIIILILVFLFVLPEYQEFQGAQAKLGEKQAEFKALAGYYKEVAEIYKNLESKKDTILKIDDALPIDLSFARIVYFFQKKGAETGLIIKSATLVPTANSQNKNNDKEIKLQQIYFNLEILGTYSALKSFLSSLENSARIFEVESISFNAPPPAPPVSPSPTPRPKRAKATPVPTPDPLQNQNQIYNFTMKVKTYAY